jgi:uncharacterized repeat protein (TIGR03803 family)
MFRNRCLSRLGAALLLAAIVTLLLAPGARAQSKFKTLHRFTGSKNNGGAPYAGLIFDQAGNLYGTTYGGGAAGRGTVFKLTPNTDGSWTESLLHSFTGGSDGAAPIAGLTFDAAGNLYGTTFRGGAGCSGKTGCGTVFELTPKSDGTWTESVIYSFARKGGAYPYAGLIFDHAGNLYGTAVGGGHHGAGVVFELKPNGNGSWTESVLYKFCALTNCADGYYPYGGLTFGGAGNLYGTTYNVVFELTPHANGSWAESVLHSFAGNDGGYSYANVIFDQSGNLYSTTELGGDGNVGVVFMLTPQAKGSWTETVLYSFQDGNDGAYPRAGVLFDQTGNLYGTTTQRGAYGWGVVFKLTPHSGGGWKQTVVHSFKSGNDGATPYGGLIFDAAGNLYGTTAGNGGFTSFGSAFEITP